MSSLWRLIYITYILRRFRLDTYFAKKYNLVVFKLIALFFFWVPNKYPQYSIGLRLRLALEHLGPLWVKLGQLLSIQDDFFNSEITQELKQLQERVQPFASKQAQAIINRDLNGKVEKLLPFIAEQPLASASIAQVYAAQLNYQALVNLKEQLGEHDNLVINDLDDFSASTNVEVVVKVIRPFVRQQIQKDLRLLRFLTSIINEHLDSANRIRSAEIVDELENSCRVELDLTLEAGNGQTLRNDWLNSHILYVPKVFFASKDIAVVERIHGTSINNYQELISKQVNTELLAKRGVEIFFRQLLEYNFFHADMHPGNIFADITDPQDPTYIAIDFGIVGSLTAIDKKYLVENLIAFFRRDYKKIAELHINSGWIRGKVEINELERQISRALDPLFNKSLNDIRLSLVLKNLFKVGRDYNMVVQPQLILLQKTLVYVEAMGRNVYPELNLWETAKPILEQWFEKEYGLKAQSIKVAKTLPHIFDFMGHVPDDVYRLFDNQQQLLQKLEQMTTKFERQQAKIINFMLFGFGMLFIVLSSLLYSLNLVFLSVVATVLSVILLVSLIIKIFIGAFK
ncbi:AarF/UbiB family protein [Psittacicella hinzii]|uniref:AarF/UbiB family protein n=1 Tax=Psittacicella hinzii TaxID=2028575 RepID=UPI0011C45DAB